jgi:hypothetical protein
MADSRLDEEKLILADSIANQLDLVLQLPASFDYPFESVKTMGKITSPDGRLRIFTWNLPYNDGTNKYYGFIQYKTDNSGKIFVFRLTDKSDDMDNPGKLTLTHSQWYGSLVYEVIEKKYEETNYYTLLSYDPVSLFLSRKIVDLLYFNTNNEPLFGKSVFHYQNQMQCRILFEYSSKVQMSLRWNARLKMIVYDHLSPSKPSNTGNSQFYGPDFSFDGLRFEKGIWEVVEDVDVKNL